MKFLRITRKRHERVQLAVTFFCELPFGIHGHRNNTINNISNGSTSCGDTGRAATEDADDDVDI